MRKQRITAVTAVAPLCLAACVSLAACGTGSGSGRVGDGGPLRTGAPPLTPLTGTEWTVTALLDGATVNALPQSARGAAHFTFRKDGSAREDGSARAPGEPVAGSVNGSLGCNTFRSPVKASGTTVTPGRLTSTRKLCPGPRMPLERQVRKVLESTFTYAVGDGALTLKTSEGRGLRAVAAVRAK
ncbi:META domain-containing protein [Streptomyces sp. NPDC051569]|uniref:META domain-containing protein n=1 Tax=Streptomyces sp. NPDC051569 TaxID=3365661 RepID=UPI0037892221